MLLKIFLILILTIFISCDEKEDASNSLLNAFTPTPVNEPKPTPKPIPTPTPKPIPTPIPTPTPVLIPTPTSELIEILILNEDTTKHIVRFDENSIRRYIQLVIPGNKVLSSLILDKYIGDDKIAFYGIYKTAELWEPNEEVVPLLSAWGHIESEKFIGKNILSYSTNLDLTIDQRVNNGYVELGSGVYIMLVQNGNIDNAEYEFSFILE